MMFSKYGQAVLTVQSVLASASASALPRRSCPVSPAIPCASWLPFHKSCAIASTMAASRQIG